MDDVRADIGAIARIDAVPKILEVVSRTTGMRFAAVARVTDDRWVACQVRDEIAFGLTPGGELPLETTLCNEIRQNGQIVVIDDVAASNAYCRHPTPALYGFQSYISVPIRRANGDFFGTLCAIDPFAEETRHARDHRHVPTLRRSHRFASGRPGQAGQERSRAARRAPSRGTERAIHCRAGARPAQSARLDRRRVSAVE